MLYYTFPVLLMSHQWFISALEDVANKVAAPSFHRLPANKAKVIHVPNTLARKEKKSGGFRFRMRF